MLLNDTAIAPPTPEQNCQSIVEQTVYCQVGIEDCEWGMIASDELNASIERITSGTETQTDIETLRLALTDSEQDAFP